MDAAYDHIQEDLVHNSTDGTTTPTGAASSSNTTSQEPKVDLNTELADTFRAISSSPWGARLGGFLGTVRKQGEVYYEGARQEYTVASGEALKGISGLRDTIVSTTQRLAISDDAAAAGESPASTDPTTEQGDNDKGKAKSQDDVIRENESLISRFKLEAAKRLKEIEKAEDAADEALLRFGTNVRNFLRDAVTIAPPTDEDGADQGKSQVLFESKDAEGRRVIHTTRFDAQLHVIHSSLDSFLRDPVSPEWDGWKSKFDVESKTEDIAKDLEKYPGLRTAMEKAVPEKVEYADFWCRYYFLRLVVETEEQKRKELLRGAAQAEEDEVAWDEDSDSDAEPSSSSTPQIKHPGNSTATLQAEAAPAQDEASLKPTEPRKSNDLLSQADSDASYDVVSGATSRAPGSPKDEKKPVHEESDEEDWE